MPLPTINANQLDVDSPVNEALVMDGLRDRDRWNYDTATAGSGVRPTVSHVTAALGTHNHSSGGTGGAQIPAAGIASGAILSASMIQAAAVTSGKTDTATISTAKLDDGAVTMAKLSGSMGTQYSGSQTFNYVNAAGADDIAIEGDGKVISHGKGRHVIVTNVATDEFYIVSQPTVNSIKIAMRPSIYSGGSGTWAWDFYVV